MKYIILITFLCLTFVCKVQLKLDEVQGFWLNIKEQSIIEYYAKNNNLTFLESDEKSIYSGGKHISKISFYNTCEPPRVDFLKSSGSYYFEISDSDVDKLGNITDKNLPCLELNVSKRGKENFMNIYDSYRQQHTTYKKIEKLPQNLEVYLKREHPSIYEDYLKMQKTPTLNSKKITAQKSIIHSSPTKPTKIYLVKGNELEVLEEKGNWLSIRY